MPIDFSPYHAVFLDLDGTLYEHDTPLPGARELIAHLASQKTRYACLSNSGASPTTVCLRLEELGMDVDPDHIYTAGAACCDYVMEAFGKAVIGDRKPRLLNVATQSCFDMLEGLVDWVDKPDEACDGILVASPASEFGTRERMKTALQLARKGAKVIGLCADRAFPGQDGMEFGAGSMTWMLAYAANVEPVFCGKPQEIFFHELCTRMEVQPDWCLLIGDNLESDILGGKSVGMRTILTLTGVSGRKDVDQLPEEMKPDLVIKNLTELL